MLHIVPFRMECRKTVIDLIVPIQQQEFGLAIDLAAQPDLIDIPGVYQQGKGGFWLALQDDQLVGTVALLDIGHGQAALRKMFVKASHRGHPHGVAQRLLKTLLDWCQRQQLREIYLGTTAQFLAAHRFYEKQGFERIDIAELPAHFPRMSVDTRFYRMQLTAAG